MSTMTKVFVVLTSVLSIALSVLFVSVTAQTYNWKELATTREGERDAALAEAQNAEARAQALLQMKDAALLDLRNQLADAGASIQQLESENARLTADLTQEKNDRLAADAGQIKLREMLSVTMNEVKSYQARNRDLQDNESSLQTRNGRLNSRVLELTSQVTILTDQIRNLQEKLYAAERSGVSPAFAAAAPEDEAGNVRAVAPRTAGAIRGEILNVDGHYAAISVGESSGVAEGMTFMVYRSGGTYLGDLTVENVRPGQAGGRLTALVQGNVRPGDQVVFGIE